MKKFICIEDEFEIKSCADRLDLSDLKTKAELILKSEDNSRVVGVFSVDEQGIDFKLTDEDCLQDPRLWERMRRMIKLGIFLCQEMFINPVL